MTDAVDDVSLANDLLSQTVVQLKQRAKTKGIVFKGNIRKAELVSSCLVLFLFIFSNLAVI